MSEYYESAEGLIITRARAIEELKSHGCTEINLFFQEVGFFKTYRAEVVLDWLGY